MKIPCAKHGVHFIDEFDQTLKGCPFWSDLGMKKLPLKYRRQVWDWFFSLGADEIWLKTGVSVKVGLSGMYAPVNQTPGQYKNEVKGYEQMSEPQRKAIQKRLELAHRRPVRAGLRRVWWFIGYHGLYQLNWRLKRKMGDEHMPDDELLRTIARRLASLVRSKP